jgi:hypothetical protein
VKEAKGIDPKASDSLSFRWDGEAWVEQLMDNACGCVQVDGRQESDETSSLVYAQRNARGSGDLMSSLQVQEQTRGRAFLDN